MTKPIDAVKRATNDVVIYAERELIRAAGGLLSLAVTAEEGTDAAIDLVTLDMSDAITDVLRGKL